MFGTFESTAEMEMQDQPPSMEPALGEADAQGEDSTNKVDP